MNPLVHLKPDGKLPCIPIFCKLNTLYILNLSSHNLLKKLFVLRFVRSYLNSLYGNFFFPPEKKITFCFKQQVNVCARCIFVVAALIVAISDHTGWARLALSSTDGVVLSSVS